MYSNALTMVFSEVEQKTHVRCVGVLDHTTIDQFERAISILMLDHVGAVRIDLSSIVFGDGGIEAIAGVERRWGASGLELDMHLSPEHPTTVSRSRPRLAAEFRRTP
jgi:hypothetical protein